MPLRWRLSRELGAAYVRRQRLLPLGLECLTLSSPHQPINPSVDLHRTPSHEKTSLASSGGRVRILKQKRHTERSRDDSLTGSRRRRSYPHAARMGPREGSFVSGGEQASGMASRHITHYETEPVAYPVPLRLDRSDAPAVYRLKNIGREPLRGLSFSLLGAGLMRATAPLLLAPGQEVSLRIRGESLPVSAVLIIRWFRPSGDEYLWRVSF